MIEIGPFDAQWFVLGMFGGFAAAALGLLIAALPALWFWFITHPGWNR